MRKTIDRAHTVFVVVNQHGYPFLEGAAYCRRDAIASFVKGSGESWDGWKTRGYRVVKAVLAPTPEAPDDE